MATTAITPDSNHASADRVTGFSIAEDASAAAKVKLRAGAVDGPVKFFINFAADESVNAVFEEAPVAFEGGCYVEEVSGSVEGSLHHE